MIKDRGSSDCGLRIADCGLRIDSDEMSQARGGAIKAGFSESTNPQSAIRNPLRGVSHIGALWYIPADTKSQNIQNRTEIETNS